MEFVIGAVLALVVTGLIRKGKPRSPRQSHAETDARRQQRKDDEIATVILPTINRDDK